MRSGRKKAENESPSKVRPGRMRILPGLAYNDVKLPLAGYSSMAGKNAWRLPGFFLSGLSDV